MNVEDGRGGLFFAARDLERDFVAGDLERDRAGDLPGVSVGIVRDNLPCAISFRLAPRAPRAASAQLYSAQSPRF